MSHTILTNLPLLNMSYSGRELKNMEEVPYILVYLYKHGNTHSTLIVWRTSFPSEKKGAGTTLHLQDWLCVNLCGHAEVD